MKPLSLKSATQRGVPLVVNVLLQSVEIMTHPFIFEATPQISNDNLELVLNRIAVMRNAGYLSQRLNKSLDYDKFVEDSVIEFYTMKENGDYSSIKLRGLKYHWAQVFNVENIPSILVVVKYSPQLSLNSELKIS